MSETTERKYVRGDLVVIKSGGPVMVVDGYDSDEHVRCIWFSNGEDNKSATFHQDLLETYVEPT